MTTYSQDKYIRLTHKSSEDVFKTILGCLQDVLKMSCQEVLKTSSRSLEDVFKTYHQVKLFLLTRFQNETYLKRFWDVLQRRLSIEKFEISEKFMVSVQTLQESQMFLKFYFLTSLHLLVIAYRDVFRTWSNITMELFLRKYLTAFLSCYPFSPKKFHRRSSTGLKIDFWLRAWNIELTLVPSLQIKPKKYSARKYVWHCFWKGERSWWDSKQNKCLWWSSHAKVL